MKIEIDKPKKKPRCVSVCVNFSLIFFTFCKKRTFFSRLFSVQVKLNENDTKWRKKTEFCFKENKLRADGSFNLMSNGVQ